MTARTLNSRVTTPTSAAAPTTELLQVDPVTAAAWLEHNTINRKHRDVDVARYASDMASGRWRLTNESIGFSTSGRLIDGQQRLKAIIKSGVTLPLFVTRGLDDEAQLYVDTGTKRTTTDQLTITGYDNPATLATAGRLAYAWATGQLRPRLDFISDSRIREFIKVNPSLCDAAEFAATLRGRPIPASVVCVVTWRLIAEGHDPDRVHEFFRAIKEMRSSGPGDPKYALLTRINTARRNKERMKSLQLIAMVVRVFNAEVNGEQIKVLKAVFNAVPEIAAPKVDAR